MSVHEDLAEEAAETLRWLLRLRLTPAEWSYADQAMRMLGDALTAADQDAVRAAVFDLDQLGRRVAEKLGTDSPTPPEPSHRDRANELIHRLTPDTEEPQREPSAEKQ
jgi:hypothetical protein